MKKETKTSHPDWALKHKKPGMELKLINGRYYLYGVKCIYDKTAKKSRKVSLGLLGRVTEEEGFIVSGRLWACCKCGRYLAYGFLDILYRHARFELAHWTTITSGVAKRYIMIVSR